MLADGRIFGGGATIRLGNLAFLSDKSVYFALIVTMLVALCAGLLGVILVLKRYSMIGDGLSHVAFGAYAIAIVTSLANNMLITVPVTIVVAILLLRIKSDGKIKGETLIAMLSSGALALGYMILNLSGSNNVSGDVCTSLFGGVTILCLTVKDIIISCVLAAIVIVFFTLYYHRIFAVTFDETFAKATGLKAELYKIFLAVVIAIVIVLSMQLVGALLISALIVFPALTSMRMVKSFRGVVILSAGVSVVSAVTGLLLACIFDSPIGSTIVVVNITLFLIVYAVTSVINVAAKR